MAATITLTGYAKQVGETKGGLPKFAIPVGKKDAPDGTTWYNVITTDKTEIIGELAQGEPVTVEGNLKIGVWNEKPSVTVFANAVHCGSESSW